MFHDFSTVSKRVWMERISHVDSYPVIAPDALPDHNPLALRGPSLPIECAVLGSKSFPEERDYKSRQLHCARLVPGQMLH